MNPYFHSQGSDLLNSSPFLSSNLEKTSAEYNTEKEKYAASKSLSEKLQNQLEQERVNLSTQKEKHDQENTALRSELAANQEKYQNLQKEYESEQATGRRNAESLQGKLDNELKRVDSIRIELAQEKAIVRDMKLDQDRQKAQNQVRCC